MESKLFAHCRKLLRKWKEVYEKMFGVPHAQSVLQDAVGILNTV